MDQPDLNMRQQRWMDIMKGYDCILYHQGKANMVADALSHKTVNTPIQDVCLWMKVMTPVLEMIKIA